MFLKYVEELINVGRQKYITNWENGNAKAFEQDGCYQWMASFVEGYNQILEVGTGDGRGTLELLKRGHKVISIDENPLCLESARTRLSTQGYNVSIVKRESISVSAISMEKCKFSYSDIDFELDETVDVYLIESDILNDALLEKWLSNIKLDAVICWLMGTNNVRAFNDVIDPELFKTQFHYRVLVQNAVYDLSDKILRDQGILQVVDRGFELSENDNEALIQHHKEQAETTSLKVQELVHTLPYKEPDNGFDVGMVYDKSHQGKQKVLQCVISSLSE
ncbi:class I SAM-dependent methyltransferase [Vibrio crassostreae]|uniref:class I SAM-dependent methyltransferase n=1 Tax=Vibrio crassostreae TaxID=246167 RepID=UPI00031E84D8|nr:class I SAM-dependent methyltransferase [Vibrio crassostreae]OEF00228.1 hypothetical protein A138_16980 [Vibrio crassostreae 9ZC77]